MVLLVFPHVPKNFYFFLTWDKISCFFSLYHFRSPRVHIIIVTVIVNMVCNQHSAMLIPQTEGLHKYSCNICVRPASGVLPPRAIFICFNSKSSRDAVNTFGWRLPMIMLFCLSNQPTPLCSRCDERFHYYILIQNAMSFTRFCLYKCNASQQIRCITVDWTFNFSSNNNCFLIHEQNVP